MQFRFRLRAFAFHLLGSALVLSLTLGGLFLGWYRWPGWYLTGVMTVSALLAGVDLTLGPLLTFLIANPAKPRRELARDIGVIVAAQLIALGYGALTLWQGRPVYYAFSGNRLEVVRAFELVAPSSPAGRASDPALAPAWWHTPRWIWAPLPADPKAADEIMRTAVQGGADVVDMPRYFRPWSEGLPTLRQNLRAPDKLTELSVAQRKFVKARLAALGLPADSPTTITMAGRAAPLVAVFDPSSMRMLALLFSE